MCCRLNWWALIVISRSGECHGRRLMIPHHLGSGKTPLSPGTSRSLSQYWHHQATFLLMYMPLDTTMFDCRGYYGHPTSTIKIQPAVNDNRIQWFILKGLIYMKILYTVVVLITDVTRYSSVMCMFLAICYELIILNSVPYFLPLNYFKWIGQYIPTCKTAIQDCVSFTLVSNTIAYLRAWWLRVSGELWKPTDIMAFKRQLTPTWPPIYDPLIWTSQIFFMGMKS